MQKNNNDFSHQWRVWLHQNSIRTSSELHQVPGLQTDELLIRSDRCCYVLSSSDGPVACRFGFHTRAGTRLVFILRELDFHSNSQCSGMCKGRLNTVRHPWFPWRPRSPYDNRIPTIAVKTLIPARSRRITAGTWLQVWTRTQNTAAESV